MSLRLMARASLHCTHSLSRLSCNIPARTLSLVFRLVFRLLRVGREGGQGELTYSSPSLHSPIRIPHLTSLMGHQMLTAVFMHLHSTSLQLLPWRLSSLSGL